MILTSGCFDGIHAGHVAFFQKLRTITNENAYVAVACDAYILQEKQRAPVWRERDRIAAVKGITGVQEAFPHGVHGVWEELQRGRYKWTAFAKGLDWLDSARLRANCRELGIAMIFLDSGVAGHNSDAR